MSAPAALIEASAAIIGASGAGKTVTAKAMVEAMLAAQRHTVVVDPTGVWYGLRSNAAGTGPGFGIVIFGGLHGDVPIQSSDGAKVAELVIDGPLSAVIDVSELRSGSEQRRFMRDFMAALRKKPKTRFHLVVDEADEFAPQTAADDAGYALLEDMIWMAKRGRVHGFVPLLITQRPADIAKAVLSQMQTLIVHQLIHPTDQAPVKAYLKGHASKEVAAEIERSLAGLQRGERWVYAPALGILERGFSPLPATFDTSRTPEAGESVAVPATLASIDATALRAALAPVPQESASGGEVQVSADIGQLRAALAKDEPVKVKGGLIDSESGREIAQLKRENADLREQLAAARAEAEKALWVLAGYQRAERAFHCLVGDVQWPDVLRHDGTKTTEPYVVPPLYQIPAQGGGGHGGDAGPKKEAATVSPPASRKPQTEPPGRQTPEKRQGVTAGENAIKLGAERKPLAVLAGFSPAGLSEAAWATLAGLKRTGGTWATYRSRLRAAGMIEWREGLVFATASGVGAVGSELPDVPPPGPGLVEFWAERVPGAGKMLRLLASRFPDFLTKNQLADALNVSASGGTFATYISRLRSNGLIEQVGKTLRVTPALMGADEQGRKANG